MRRGASSSGQDVVREHAALVRLLGDLQRRVAWLQQAHADECQALQAELMRQRGQIMASRTRVLWGLAAWGDWPEGAGQRPAAEPLAPVPAARRRPVAEPLATAHAVICQTGCVGHAHPWREPDGQCRCTGQPCEPPQAMALCAPVDAPRAR